MSRHVLSVQNQKRKGSCQRSEYADYYEINLINVKNKEHLYKKRQVIVEHPYGTIKRQWGFSYISELRKELPGPVPMSG